MRIVNLLLLVTAGLSAGIGCGDDTATGGSGAGGGSGASNPSGGNGGQPSTGGNGGGPVGGNGGEATGGGGGGPGGMGPGFSCDDPTGDPPSLSLTSVANESNVIQIKSAPGRPEDVFLVRQNGEILILTAAGSATPVLLPTPFIDVSNLIQSGGEEGLLGLAFHPDYATNGRFFLHYSADNGGDSTVTEFVRSADENVASPDPVQLVIEHPTAQGNHNGGAVEFGNDGFLYITMGDGGLQGDPGCDAMNPANLLGKIMRVDVDGTPDGEGYPAAAGNPDGAKYYHIGFRNPWRISFDTCTGDLYIGDVGQNTYEEVDVISEAQGAQNCGWPVREGLHAYGGYDGSCINPPATPLDPITEYTHNDGCSITGGYVYRGSAMPGLRGWYFYGDYCSGDVSFFRQVGGTIVGANAPTGLTVPELTAFGQDGNGEVYAADHGGVVYRIDQAQ